MNFIYKKIKVVVSSLSAALWAATKMAGARMLSRALILVGGNQLMCCDCSDEAA
jgi:hypothetical protein